MNSLGIAIDGGRYVRIQSSVGDFPQTIRLRTLQASQDSARLDFCVFRKGRPQVRRSHHLKGLSSRNDVPSELKLRIERRHYAVWEARVDQPGGKSDEFRIRTGIGLWPLLLLILLLLFTGFWFLLNSMGLIGFPSVTKNTVVSLRSTESAPDAAAAPATIVKKTQEVEKAEAAETGRTVEAIPEVSKNDTAPGGIPEPSESAVSQLTVAELFDEIVVYFAPDSSRLSSRARESLAEAVSSIPEEAVIEISGHCAGFGTERGRRALSLVRARVTEGYITALLPQSVTIEVKGYAYDEPSSTEIDQQHLNRRVVVRQLENDS